MKSAPARSLATNPPPPHQRTKALLYCRVSTVKQTIEGSGLQSQELRCRAYAAEKGYDVEAVFPDDASGGGDYMARPGMVRLLGYLDRHPGQDYVVIFDDLKRFARDTASHLKLRQALSSRGARVECLNFTFEGTPEGQFVETVFAAQGQLEREQNRRQVIQKMKARIQAGYYCRSKPVGYRYEKVDGHGRMLVPDEPNAGVIKEAIEGFASGRFETAAEVARFLKSHPSIPTRVTRQRATDILRRPLYAGYITIPHWGFVMHTGKHEPLVSLATWQAVQDRLDARKNRPARKDVHQDFPLRNFVTCEGCGTAMTAGWSKGRSRLYGYYTCQQKGCTYRGKSIRKERIETAFGTLIKAMTPRPELLRVAAAMFKDIWEGRMSALETQRAEMAAQLADLDKRMDALMKRLVTASSDAVIGAYEVEIAKIEHEKRLLRDRATTALEPQKSFDDCFRSAINFLAKP
ncbi:MAG: recombinase family protein [Pseudomonadota bacterium]